MKKRSVFSLLTGSLLIFSSGCQFLPGGGGEVDEVVISPDGQEIVPPEIPLRSARVLPPVDMASLGLIPPILPDQRLGEIQAGRNNPFALIPIQPTVISAASVVDSESIVDGIESATTSNGNTADGNTPDGNGNTSVSGDDASVGSPSGDGTGLIALDKLPDPEPVILYPDDARAVVVSGIIRIGNRSYAIVKAPGEPVARNVTVGDFLSGGSVRVQSINIQGENSSIVLEQYGESVTRDVGAPALPPLTPPPSLEPEPPTNS